MLSAAPLRKTQHSHFWSKFENHIAANSNGRSRSTSDLRQVEALIAGWATSCGPNVSLFSTIGVAYIKNDYLNKVCAS